MIKLAWFFTIQVGSTAYILRNDLFRIDLSEPFINQACSLCISNIFRVLQFSILPVSLSHSLFLVLSRNAWRIWACHLCLPLWVSSSVSICWGASLLPRAPHISHPLSHHTYTRASSAFFKPSPSHFSQSPSRRAAPSSPRHSRFPCFYCALFALLITPFSPNQQSNHWLISPGVISMMIRWKHRGGDIIFLMFTTLAAVSTASEHEHRTHMCSAEGNICSENAATVCRNNT